MTDPTFLELKFYGATVHKQCKRGDQSKIKLVSRMFLQAANFFHLYSLRMQYRTACAIPGVQGNPRKSLVALARMLTGYAVRGAYVARRAKEKLSMHVKTR